MEDARAALRNARHRTGASINVLLKLAELADNPLGVGEDALRRFANSELDLSEANWRKVGAFFYETEVGRFLVGFSSPQSPYWRLVKAFRAASLRMQERGVIGAYLCYHAGYSIEDEFVVRLINIQLGDDEALVYSEYIQEQHLDKTVHGHNGDGVVVGVGSSLILIPFNPCPFRPFRQIILHQVAMTEGSCRYMIGTILGVIGHEESLRRNVLLMKPNTDMQFGKIKRRAGAWRWQQLTRDTQQYFAYLKDHIEGEIDPVSRVQGVRRK